MSHTIAFVNGKGGVGKTTAALLLAAALQDAKQDVGLVDEDPQGSATVLSVNLNLRMNPLAPVVILDTPPTLSHPATLNAIRTADLLILITTPSPTDLGATASTAELILAERGDRPCRLLFNRVQASNRFAHQLPALAARFPFPTLTNVLYQRTAYQVAQLDGWRSIPALARTEVLRVAVELLDRGA
jgi:chromosome partitioning protein